MTKHERGDKKPKKKIGDDNTVIGQGPDQMGSGNTIVNLSDSAGNVILNEGGLAIGRGAQADSTSIAIGAGANAGSQVLIEALFQQAYASIDAAQGLSPEDQERAREDLATLQVQSKRRPEDRIAGQTIRDKLSFVAGLVGTAGALSEIATFFGLAFGSAL